MENAKSFLTSKPVLYGGAAIGALLAYMYFSNRASTSADQSAAPASSDIAYPYSVVYGMGAAQTGGGATSVNTSNAVAGLSSGDQALVDLQVKQLDISREQMNLNYNLSVLQTNDTFQTDMANIAATKGNGYLDTISKTFLAAEKSNPNLHGLNANINGETVGITVVPPPGVDISSITMGAKNPLLLALFGRAA